MKTDAKRLYEAMFLIDTAIAAAEWQDTLDMITAILEKSGCEVVSLRKWDECKLAYPINKKERGSYILCYFRSDSSKITEIERSINLNEKIMRALILKGEHLTPEDVEKDTPAARAAKIEASRMEQAKADVEKKASEEAAKAEEIAAAVEKPAETVEVTEAVEEAKATEVVEEVEAEAAPEESSEESEEKAE